jgi:hypothetical protein
MPAVVLTLRTGERQAEKTMRRLLLLAVILVGGCSTDIGPSKEELREGREAQNVFPQNYKADLLAYMRSYLNDPSRIRGAGVSEPARKDIGSVERYVACVRFNARKSNGAYAGPKEGAATYVSGKLDRFIDTPPEVKELCKDAVYTPFPELEALSR